jgi:hypothetical protein
MFYGYIHEFQITKRTEISDDVSLVLIKRLQSDIRAIGRIKDSIETGQREDLTRAKEDLLKQMRKSEFNQESEEVDFVFKLWLW